MVMNKLELIIDDFKNRGVLSNCANPENFTELEAKQKSVYLGIDCTADSLHIGHLLPFMQAVRLASNDFKIFMLLGGATSKIGDPSDKLKERPILQAEVLETNQRRIEAQLQRLFSKTETRETLQLAHLPLTSFFATNNELLTAIYQVLNLDSQRDGMWSSYLAYIWPVEVNDDSFEIVDNRSWLNELTFVEFIDKYGRNITINYLLSKETIKQRINSENGLSFSAFSYSLLQAYDFFHLYKNHGCHGQLGASDQWGNVTTGLKMIKSFDNDNKCFALAFNLILDDNGKKISKSDLGKSLIWLDSAKTDFPTLFNYFNNLSDEKAVDYVRKFTFITELQIKQLLALNTPKSLRILQRILTELFFFLMHGKDGLEWISTNFQSTSRPNFKNH